MQTGSWNQTKMGLKEILGFYAYLCALELKSDQDGIERVSMVLQNSARTFCWNQTKMGLKGLHCVIMLRES